MLLTFETTNRKKMSNDEAIESIKLARKLLEELDRERGQLHARVAALEACLKKAITKYESEMTNPFYMEWFKEAKQLIQNK